MTGGRAAWRPCSPLCSPRVAEDGLRAPYLRAVWGGEIVERFALVKRAFDPQGILNPGAKVALADDIGIGDVKYDPALAPLSPSARRALDHVEQARAYSAFRLELLDR